MSAPKRFSHPCITFGKSVVFMPEVKILFFDDHPTTTLLRARAGCS